MYHPRLRPLSELDAAAIHPMVCPCVDCSANGDPIAHARASRTVRLQAITLGAFLVSFYALALSCAPAIASAFGLGR